MCLFAMVGLKVYGLFATGLKKFMASFFFFKNDIFRDKCRRNERISNDARKRKKTVRSTKPRSNFSLFHIGFL